MQYAVIENFSLFSVFSVALWRGILYRTSRTLGAEKALILSHFWVIFEISNL